MVQKHGFLLIECMVYVALVCIVGVLMGIALHKTHQSVEHAQTRCCQLVQTATAVDFLCRDIQGALADVATWSCAQDEVIFWHEAKKIRWFVQDTTLMRSAGKASSVIAKNMAHMSVAIARQEQGEVLGVVVEVQGVGEGPYATHRRHIQLCNGSSARLDGLLASSKEGEDAV